MANRNKGAAPRNVARKCPICDTTIPARFIKQHEAMHRGGQGTHKGFPRPTPKPRKAP
jgi:hypothetical protein